MSLPSTFVVSCAHHPRPGPLLSLCNRQRLLVLILSGLPRLLSCPSGYLECHEKCGQKKAWLCPVGIRLVQSAFTIGLLNGPVQEDVAVIAGNLQEDRHETVCKQTIVSAIVKHVVIDTHQRQGGKIFAPGQLLITDGAGKVLTQVDFLQTLVELGGGNNVVVHAADDKHGVRGAVRVIGRMASIYDDFAQDVTS